MDATTKTKIENEIVTYLKSNPNGTTTVMVWAWAYDCHSTAITPIFNKLLREKKITKDSVSCVGNKIYRAYKPLERIANVLNS